MGNPEATESSLLARLQQGDRRAADELTRALYPELRRLAVARMKAEKPGHTWQASDLINELYMELAKIRRIEPCGGAEGQGRAAFLGLASHIMRRLLCGHARRLYRRVTKTPLDEIGDALPDPKKSDSESIEKIDRLLAKLHNLNPRLRIVVELRVFEGLSGDEIAERLGCTRRTVVRDWAFAKQLIARELGAEV